MKSITVIILFLSAFLFSRCRQTISSKSEKNQIVFTDLFSSANNEKVACYRIPAIVTATNGDLIVAVDERVPNCGDLRSNENCNIILRRSQDNGFTWSDIETVVDFPMGESASDPSMIVNQTSGEIILFYNYMDLNNAKDIYKLHVVKSKDHGKTWSQPEDITTQITKPEWEKDFQFITSGRGAQTKDGKLIHTLVNLQKGLFVFESDNHGSSWNLIDVAISPGDESKIIELSDGSWMINSRVNEKGVRFIHFSNNNGQTWQTEARTDLIDPGCNATTITIEKKNKEYILFANAKSDKMRNNLTIRSSDDGGKTWSNGQQIYAGASAYSTITELENGKIGILFEKDDYSKITFTTIDVEDLIRK